MTPTTTLREALEEAREALAGCMSVWARHRSRRNQQEVEDDTTRAVIALLARIDAALSAPEAQGCDRSRYGYNRLYRAISVAVRPDWESRTLHISVERFEDMMEAREGGANVVLHETPPPPEPQQ